MKMIKKMNENIDEKKKKVKYRIVTIQKMLIEIENERNHLKINASNSK